MTSKTSRPGWRSSGRRAMAHAAELVLVILLCGGTSPLLACLRGFFLFLFLRSDSLCGTSSSIFSFFFQAWRVQKSAPPAGEWCRGRRRIPLLRFPTSTSVIWCESRMIFSRVRRIFPFPCLKHCEGRILAGSHPWRFANFDFQISISGFSLRSLANCCFTFFVHLLIRDAGPAHFVLVGRSKSGALRRLSRSSTVSSSSMAQGGTRLATAAAALVSILPAFPPGGFHNFGSHVRHNKSRSRSHFREFFPYLSARE